MTMEKGGGKGGGVCEYILLNEVGESMTMDEKYTYRWQNGEADVAINNIRAYLEERHT